MQGPRQGGSTAPEARRGGTVARPPVCIMYVRACRIASNGSLQIIDEAAGGSASVLGRELAPLAEVLPSFQKGTSSGVSAQTGTRGRAAVCSSGKHGKKYFLCIVCGKGCREGVTLQACGTVMYCGQDCQRRHWPQHKAERWAGQAERWACSR